MYKIDLTKLFVLMLLGLCGLTHATSNSSIVSPIVSSIDLQRADGSIASEVVYQGDHYFGATGAEIKVFRKKGVYV